MMSPSRVWDVIPYQLITTGVGCFWSAAGGGRVAMVGVTLVFIGDIVRLLLRLQRGPVPAVGSSTGIWPAAPFVIMGLISNEGLIRLAEVSPEATLVQALRVGAALYALAVLWYGPPGGPSDIWGRILGVQIGAAQALLLGIPAGWLVRSASLAAGRPDVGAAVALMSGLLWLFGSVRVLRRLRIPVGGRWPALAVTTASLLVLAALRWMLRVPAASVDTLMTLAGSALILGFCGTAIVWIETSRPR